MDDVVVFLFGTLLMTGAVVAAGAVLFVVLLARVVGAGRRRVEAAAGTVRLRARAVTAGPVAEVARLRLELRSAVDSVRRALAGAHDADWPVGDAPALLRRLETVAGGLDAELAVLEPERDSGRLVRALADIRPRVAAVGESAASLRYGLLGAAAQLGSDTVHLLHRDCVIEARALRGYSGT